MSVTAEHRAAALRRANEIRLRRAALLGGGGRFASASRKIPASRTAELIEDPPEELLNMRIDLLLARTIRYRSARATELLRREKVTETRLVGELTERQRKAIAARLRGER